MTAPEKSLGLSRGPHAEEIESLRHQLRIFEAVFETVGALTRLRDVDQVLGMLVRRTRDLLHAEVAYLLLYDDVEKALIMRCSEGVVSDAFLNIRLPVGEGLAGKVAEEDRVAATSSYLDDPRFLHDPKVDEIIRGEGLAALVLAPISLESQIIGVLCAADRYQREFSREEIRVLGLFADHSAIAIENARLFQGTREALAERDLAYAEIKTHGQLVEAAADSHARLTALVARGADVADLATAVSEIFSSSVLLTDPSGSVLAYGGDSRDRFDDLSRARGALPRSADLSALFNAIADRSAAGGAEHIHLSNFCDRWVARVVASGNTLGALLVATDRPFAEGEQRNLERAAQVTALLFLNRQSMAERRRRVCNELMVELFAREQPDEDRVRELTDLVHRPIERPHVVVVASVARSAVNMMAAEAQSLMEERECLVFLRGSAAWLW